MLKISNIYKSYGKDENKQQVIKGLSLTLPNRGFFSILGKSGSGKTTLLNLIGGIDNVDSGNIELNNLSYSNLSSSEWNTVRTNLISFVFQEYNLLDQFTVIENLRFAIPSVEDSVFIDTLEKFELESKKDKYPNQLSGGEKQRIAIIRALLKDSKIILIDEPTGNLDEESSLMVMDFLKEVIVNKLVIMITHDKDIALKYSTQVLHLTKGALEETVELENKIDDIDLKQSHSLPFTLKDSLKLSFKQMRKKWSKLIQYVFMFTVTLLFLSYGFSLILVNEYSIASRNLIESNTKYYMYEPIYVDNSDEKRLFDNLESTSHILYNSFTMIFEDYDVFPEDSYLSRLNGFITYYDDIDIIHGNKPIESNHIVISDYLAYALMTDLNNIATIEEVVGITIPNTNIVVSGIYDTDYESYNEILEEDGCFFYNDEMDLSMKSILQYKVDEVYPIAYTSANFDFSSLYKHLRGWLPEYATGSNYANADIITFDNNQDVIYSSYNQDIVDPNDIYISKNILYLLLQRDFSYNISSDTEFETLWNDDEQELVEYVINRNIELGHLIYSYDQYIPYDTLVIKGVYTDDSTYDTIQVSKTHYNNIYKSNYIYAIENHNVYELERDIQLLDSKGYDFDGFLLNEIMMFAKQEGPVLTLIAFGISIILSIFSVLLFINLLSRDILSMKSEIGLLRTLGIKLSSISYLFLFEIIFIAIVSFVITIVLHPIGLKYLNRLLTSGYNSLSIVSFDIRTILFLLLFIVFITLITIIIPFMKLSKLSLIDCIKREI